MSVEEHVRNELARELHDLVVQELISALVDLENFKRGQHDQPAVVEEVDRVQGSLRRALQELRHLLYDLRDGRAWQASFMGSLEDLARGYDERSGINVNVVVNGDWPSRMRPAPAKHLQRIIHEALNNARLHSGARSVLVSMLAETERLRVTIMDDGRGLDPDFAEASGLGIVGLRERAQLLGGWMTVERAPERGTLVRVDIPRLSLA